MDERLRLVPKVGGGSEFRIKETDLADMGPEKLAAELAARGFSPEDLGPAKPQPHKKQWIIPVRKGGDE
ncbi:hypothetical protein [Cryobacterium cryoconiti]|uniref:Uncharacterized protein n=1 Tax=Cryobacterium cryoconiti TaxID=1259239 RepID=A0A4Y8JSH4_9MICO|nr:hypothetical protein [Cryobacterium cryoconiti]TFD27470.1 hypothetical protein E3T49_13075 [Cryobacterium cryoconiti]